MNYSVHYFKVFEDYLFLLILLLQMLQIIRVGIRDNKKYFFPRGKIENYNVSYDGKFFYDKPINDLI